MIDRPVTKKHRSGTLSYSSETNKVYEKANISSRKRTPFFTQNLLGCFFRLEQSSTWYHEEPRDFTHLEMVKCDH